MENKERQNGGTDAVEEVDPFDEIITDVNEIKQFLLALDDPDNQLDEKKKEVLIYESYSSILELITDFKDILSGLRKEYKVKEADVKKWMKENVDEAVNEDEK